jgi:hypothetical protein
LKTWFQGQSLLVINEKNGGYFNIESEEIQFNIGDIRITDWMLLPHSFVLKVHNKQVSLNINMSSITTHHMRIMGVINYWRYHVKCTGSITIDSQLEIINDTYIAEFMRFR